MARNKIRVEGIKSARTNTQRLLNGLGARVESGLENGAEVAKNASIRRTPIEEGDLRAGYRITSQITGRNAKVALANIEEYAAYVHEQTAEKLRGLPRPGNRRGRYWDGGESKFLEKGVFENVEDIMDAIKNASRFTRID